MMYWPFPAVTPADRLQRAASLDSTLVLLSPEEAANRLGVLPAPEHTRLNSFDGRPVYRFAEERGTERMVFADTGDEPIRPTREMMDRVASSWTRVPADGAHVELVTDVDQWTIQAPLRNFRPLWKYSWPDGEHVYISGTSGEVVQYTTTASRVGAYLGPIPHWLYFTSLRRHQRMWSTVVIWASAAATLTAVLGLSVGIWMTMSSASIPYRGTKRWHTVFGLIFGIAAITWAFSGMLSMDPFPLGRAEGANASDAANLGDAIRGTAGIEAFAQMHPRAALALLAWRDVKQLELATFADEPVYLATFGDGRTQIVRLNGDMPAEFDRDVIAERVRRAVPHETSIDTFVINQYDRYYLDRDRQRPLPVMVAVIADAERMRYYIDPKTARIVGVYSDRDWARRWLYHGLHSLDFPWLYNYRPIWDIIVVGFMLGGAALGVTAIALAWRVAGRALARSAR